MGVVIATLTCILCVLLSVSDGSQKVLSDDDFEANAGHVMNRRENRPHIVSMVLSTPFTMLKQAWEENVTYEGNDRYEGYCVDLIAMLANKLGNFEYVIKLVGDGKYGTVSADGAWNGMVGELLRNEADLAVAPLTITQARQHVVDFSQPFMTGGISIMIKKPEKREYAYVLSLSTELWLKIVLVYLAVSVVAFLLARFSPYDWRLEASPPSCMTTSKSGSCWSCLWCTFGPFSHQGTYIRSVLARIACAFWWFATFFVVASYAANLSHSWHFPQMVVPIESAEDLAAQTHIKCGTIAGGSTANFFQQSSISLYQRMWSSMSNEQPSVFVANYDEGIRRVRNSKGRYALFLESTMNDFVNLRSPCDTMKVGQNLNSFGYGIATPVGSDLREKINVALLALQEGGHLKKLENKWWSDRAHCMESDPSATWKSQSYLLGPIYTLIIAALVAIVAVVAEVLYRKRLRTQTARRQQDADPSHKGAP